MAAEDGRVIFRNAAREDKIELMLTLPLAGLQPVDLRDMQEAFNRHSRADLFQAFALQALGEGLAGVLFAAGKREIKPLVRMAFFLDQQAVAAKDERARGRADEGAKLGAGTVLCLNCSWLHSRGHMTQKASQWWVRPVLEYR